MVDLNRPPRIQPELPFEEREIPAPPDRQFDAATQLFQIGLPVATIAGYVLVTVLSNGRNPLLLVSMAFSVLASVVFSIYIYFKERQKQAQAEREYLDHLGELYQEMHTFHELQRRFYRYNYPEAQTAIRIAEETKNSISSSQGNNDNQELRLWERRFLDSDFGLIRLGVGTLPSTITYKLSQGSGSSPLWRKAQKLEADARYVSDIPVVLALRPQLKRDNDKAAGGGTQKTGQTTSQSEAEFTPPLTYALAITGERDGVYQFAHSFLTHYLVFHSPADAKLFILATSRQRWAWTGGLLHASGNDDQSPIFFSNEVVEQDKTDQEEATALDQYLENIRRILAQRKMRQQERGDKKEESDKLMQPFLLLVVDLLDVADDPHDLLHQVQTDGTITILLEEGAALGAAIVFLVPKRSNVPDGCQAVIEVGQSNVVTNFGTTQSANLHFRYAEVGVNTGRYVGLADAVTNPDQMRHLTDTLKLINLRQSASANLPNNVPFLTLMKYNSLRELEQGAKRNWGNSISQDKAGWLRARLGMMAGNKVRTLEFSAKKDGSHGIIAGSTGSGKSELLISLITSMAAAYDPRMLNFVLVDYKGGGTFEELKNLPHCVDVISNLNGDAVTRMFTAINAEIHRREKLNTDRGVKNIVDYHQKDLHNTIQPYPFLFIIIDEFAEMIADRTEYKTQLETITRVGRSLGVLLLLAAQRPSGVTDQMRANIKFRVCLRVESGPESRELLRRNDAAYLPSNIPGRGYLQVGNDEIELIQVGYAGEPYTEGLAQKVIWPDRNSGQQIIAGDSAPPELYKLVVKAMKGLAEAENVPKQLAPWPKFLPKELALSQPLLTSPSPEIETITSDHYLIKKELITLGISRSDPALCLNPALSSWLEEAEGWLEPLNWDYALRAVIGLVDNPYEGKQFPLAVDLPRGHAIVLGGSGWGKTTFIKTLLVSLTVTHSPNALHLYIVDLGGRKFDAFKSLPHTGAVITSDETGFEERVEQLLRELNMMMEERKLLLSKAGRDDLEDYNKRNPTQPIPALVVAIDNFGEFISIFGKERDNVTSLLNQFLSLTQYCSAYGIYFVISANQLSGLPSNLLNIFTERFALRLSDSTDYRAVLGKQPDVITEIVGRGYAIFNQQLLSCQLATAFDLRSSQNPDNTNETELIGKLGKQMDTFLKNRRLQGYNYLEPRMVDALPTKVLLKELLIEKYELKKDQNLLESLRKLVRQNWKDSIEPDKADWLQVMVGRASGNRPKILQLEAQKDGVHALIAGGTGSGKSELLMSLISSLALTYDPSALNFVLVDYKGGGAFKPFETLPHCVDLVTNLNKMAVERMFTAIGAEMDRRSALNADKKVKDIVDYRRRGMHQLPGGQPYPFLFIIIDEYAEMISENPDFGEKLNSIARVGRSLGVHLFLASQRPVGVSDQMRANIKLRICLRVEQVDTSVELLRRSDAAFLPNGLPGRGYVQAGNETIELIQTAYTGEVFEGVQAKEGEEPPRFYDMVVELAQELLNEKKVAHPRSPWPKALPTELTFSSPLVEDYIKPTDSLLLKAGHNGPLVLNPYIEKWLEQPTSASAAPLSWPLLNWRQNDSPTRAVPALNAIVGLVDDPAGAQQLPLTIDFRRGHAVVFGVSGSGKTGFLRSLVTSLAATHNPRELHLHILDLGGGSLTMLGKLPQVGTIIMPDERGYDERVRHLWRELNNLIALRKREFGEAGVTTLTEYNVAHPDATRHAVLVIIDNFAEYMDNFGSTAQTGTKDDLLTAFIDLARQGRTYGVHFIVTADRLNVLSSKLYSLFTERFTLRLGNADEYVSIVGTGLGEIDTIAGRGATRLDRKPLLFQVAQARRKAEKPDEEALSEIDTIKALSQAMQKEAEKLPDKPKPFKIDALPENVPYRKMLAEEFGITSDEEEFPKALKGAVQQGWSEQRKPKNADWLRVLLGKTAGDEKRELTFEAKVDGVHAMVAGGTGSGKSELLMTLIVGLALRYPPDVLNFVLVDYKGGGAFKPFENLPHCVDLVTNLNKTAVGRMFTAIRSEMDRRQELNAQKGVSHIVDYRRKGFSASEPYPFLFIIIDEYAEMISDNPDYRQQLETITRLGRSVGVTLILASQRPKGVSDQMRENIKLRLCLRVEQIETSQDLLRRPDAALLPNGLPGRGYIQVGNENIELIQVAWAGEELPAAAKPDDRDKDPPKLFGFAVELARELNANQFVPRPWPRFLPEATSLYQPLTNGKTGQPFILEPVLPDWLAQPAERPQEQDWPQVDWQGKILNPVIGLLDDPKEARQEPYRVNLKQNHLVICGDSGSGKSALLRTIITSLAVTHSPRDVQFYLLDLGGHTLSSLKDLPHVGAVIHGDDDAFEERLQRLLEFLTRQLENRQRLLSSENNVFDFNTAHPEQKLPAIIVVIDNIAELRENYEGLVEDVLLPLVRRSAGVCIRFIVTCNIPGNMQGKLYGLFAERITLHQSNKDVYMDIVGPGTSEIDSIPGRGYIRDRSRPLLLQTALAAGQFNKAGKSVQTEAADMLKIIGNMQTVVRQWTTSQSEWSRPEDIPILQTQIGLQELLKVVKVRRELPTGAIAKAVIGMGSDLEPVELDLWNQGPHFLIVGPPLSGRTTALRNCILSLAKQNPPDRIQLVLIDLQRKLVQHQGQFTLGGLPQVLEVIEEEEGLPDLVARLKQEGEQRTKRTASQNGSVEHTNTIRPYPELFVIIDNLDEIADKISDELALIMRRYGSAGIHLIASSSGESGQAKLRRAIQSYGLGLRSSQAVEALKVYRTPAELRSRELPVGRGFLVRSGIPTLVQLAIPHALPDGDNMSDIASELDQWVKQIKQKWGNLRASWTIPTSSGSTNGVKSATPQKQSLVEILEASTDLANTKLTKNLLQLEPAVLEKWLWERWKQLLLERNTPDVIIEGLMEAVSPGKVIQELLELKD